MTCQTDGTGGKFPFILKICDHYEQRVLSSNYQKTFRLSLRFLRFPKYSKSAC